jgi:hypothetical protein
VWSTAITIADGGVTSFEHIATDAVGNVFIAGTSGSPTIWERRVGQSGLTVIDSLPNGEFFGITTDAAGDIFAAGVLSVTTTVKGKATTTVNAIVRKCTPVAGGGFVSSTSTLGTSLDVVGVTVIGSGSAAGVYVAGYSTSNYWEVFKSSSGGGNWSMVDQFRYNASYGSDAYAVTGDAAGNVYAAGLGQAAVVTGYSRGGKPIYSTVNHWIVRKSVGGNSGWSTVDDYLPSNAIDAEPIDVGVDLAGNIYAVGYAGAPWQDATDAIVRTNAGGSWSTSDDFAGPAGTAYAYNAFAVDSAGTIYAGGDDMGLASNTTFVRSTPGPAAPDASATRSTLFSSIAISGGIGGASMTNDVDSLLDSIH